MSRAWQWILAALAVAGLFGVWIWYRLKGNPKAANRTMADAVDAWSGPRIDRARAKAEELRAQLGSEHAVVEIARAQVDDHREALREKYQKLDLTPEEIEARFKHLRV